MLGEACDEASNGAFMNLCSSYTKIPLSCAPCVAALITPGISFNFYQMPPF